MPETVQHTADGKVRAEIRNGTIYCHYNTEQQLQETRIENGKTTVTVAPISQVIPGYKPDIFHASPDSRNPIGMDWRADIDCGFQRWYGPMSRRKIANAMKKLGFTTPEIKKLLDLCVQQEIASQN